MDCHVAVMDCQEKEANADFSTSAAPEVWHHCVCRSIVDVRND